jgi:hypothetical protein
MRRKRERTEERDIRSEGAGRRRWREEEGGV